jgi:hypothetical protein
MVNARAKLSGRERFHDISFLIFRIRAILSDRAARGRRHESRDGYVFLAREPQIRPDEKAESRERKKMPRGSAQPSEKARFGQGNQRKSKLFSWFSFAPAWPGFAGFG